MLPLPVTQTVPQTETLTPFLNTKKDSLQILPTVISDFLTPTVTIANDKRKHSLDRPYGKSLTTVEAFHKIQEKENQAEKRKKQAKRRRPQQNGKILHRATAIERYMRINYLTKSFLSFQG